MHTPLNNVFLFGYLQYFPYCHYWYTFYNAFWQFSNSNHLQKHLLYFRFKPLQNSVLINSNIYKYSSWIFFSHITMSDATSFLIASIKLSITYSDIVPYALLINFPNSFLLSKEFGLFMKLLQSLIPNQYSEIDLFGYLVLYLFKYYWPILFSVIMRILLTHK